MQTLYPLKVSQQHITRIWGGQKLAAWLPANELCPADLGEIWLAFDTSTILNGPLCGQPLRDVVEHVGADLVGTRSFERYGADFPLLAKLIDACRDLSIQVHPDDSYAHTHEAATGYHGKTEAWYVLHAEPGAEMICGLNRACSRDEFTAAVQGEALDPMLNRIPVETGDTIFVPAGMLHAIGAGIVLYEIQEKSDLTYRVYDYGRVDPRTGQTRQLHLDKALDVLHYGPPIGPRVLPLELDDEVQLLVTCSYFGLEKLTLRGRRFEQTSPNSLELLTVVAGQGCLYWEGGCLSLSHGETVVLPATLGTYELQAVREQTDPALPPLTMLRAYIPDPITDLYGRRRSQQHKMSTAAKLALPQALEPNTSLSITTRTPEKVEVRLPQS